MVGGGGGEVGVGDRVTHDRVTQVGVEGGGWDVLISSVEYPTPITHSNDTDTVVNLCLLCYISDFM